MLLLRLTVEVENLFSSLDAELVVAPCFNMRLKKESFMTQILEWGALGLSVFRILKQLLIHKPVESPFKRPIFHLLKKGAFEVDKLGCERILGPGITGDQIVMSLALLGCHEPLKTFSYIEVLSEEVPELSQSLLTRVWALFSSSSARAMY